MKKELICVICPNGCQLQAEIQEGDRPAVTNVTGNLCDKGPEWARQEIINPMRTIASSVLVEDGDLPMVSVRTDSAIPLKKIFEVMKEIKAARVHAPVRIGDLIIEKVAGLTCNIIATRNVKKTEDGRPKTDDGRRTTED
jgi:CxxC motif-containing protein